MENNVDVYKQNAFLKLIFKRVCRFCDYIPFLPYVFNIKFEIKQGILQAKIAHTIFIFTGVNSAISYNKFREKNKKYILKIIHHLEISIRKER